MNRTRMLGETGLYKAAVLSLCPGIMRGLMEKKSRGDQDILTAAAFFIVPIDPLSAAPGGLNGYLC